MIVNCIDLRNLSKSAVILPKFVDILHHLIDFGKFGPTFVTNSAKTFSRFRTIRIWSDAEVRKSCRSKKMLQIRAE